VLGSAPISPSRRAWKAFKKAFPAQYIEIGVAEQMLVAMAGDSRRSARFRGSRQLRDVQSRAARGSKSARSWRSTKANVKIAGAHAGVSVGPDGATHQAIEDIAIMRVIPHMTVVVPCDSIQTKESDARGLRALRAGLSALRAR
jgi:transketolase